MQSVGVFQAAGLIGRTGEPNSSLGIRRALWRPLGGGHSPRTHSHLPVASSPSSSKSPNFPAADLGTHGRHIEAEEWGSG